MFKLDYPFKKEILACGAQNPANFCLTKRNCGFVINDFGNLSEHTVLEHYQSEIERLKTELKIKPKVITHDLDPEYSSTKYAQALLQKSSGLKFVPIQHHKAHLASCIGENGITGKVIGVVFDCSGLGEDGQSWGGEFFVGSPEEGFKRIAHFKYSPMLNGKEAYYGSSVARFFDSVCALAGLRERVGYEGQGVVDLERIVNRSTHVAGKIYDFTLKQEKDKFIICPEQIFQNIVEDLQKNISKSIISAAFHNTIVEIVRQLCHKIKQSQKVKDVILTGIVFQDKFLFNRLKSLLTEDGFKIIPHKHFPCNDSNISFGQAVLADAK